MNATDLLGSGLAWLWRATWQASVLALLVLLVQRLFRAKLTPQWRHALWWLVLIRLLLPVAPAASFSIFNLARVEPAVRSGARLESVWYGGFWKRGPAFEREVTPQVLSPALPGTAQATAQTRSESPPAPASVPATTPLSGAAVSPAQRALWIVFGLWLAGVLFLSARLIYGNASFARRLRPRAPSSHPAVLATLEECRPLVGVRQPLAIVETPEVDSPALFGCFRIKLLLPPRIAETFSPAQLRHVFLHELAHVRRRDVPTNWLMTLVQIAHWFNPVIWLAFSRMRADRELACDALALSLVKVEESRSYGQTIIKLLENYSRPAAMPAMVGILEDKNQMKRRIDLIAKFEKTTRAPVLPVLLLLGLGAVFLTDAQTEKSGATPPTAPVNAGNVIDLTNGLRYVVAKRVSGTNDIIDYDGHIALSPNGKFLLWWGQLVPLDGSPKFDVKELKWAGIAAWSPDGRQIAFNSGGIEVLSVSPETGRPTGPPRKLLEEQGDWFRGRIYWSADSERILYVKWNGRMEREVGSINLRDGRLNQQPDFADFGLLSPDGKKKAYSIPQGGIWAQSAGGGDGRIVRPRTGGWLSDDVAVWTPDSQWVVSAVKGWQREEIHFARVSDGQGFDLFPPDAAGAFVGSSMEGRKLYFYHSSFESRPLFKVIPVSGAPSLDIGLSNTSDYPWDHSWAADTASLAVVVMGENGRDQLWSTSIGGGNRVEFNLDSIGTNQIGIWSLSPDNKRVMYQESSGTNQGTRKVDLYIVPISLKEGRATEPAKLVFEGWRNPNPTVAEQVGAWSPDGTQVAMPHQADPGQEIWILSADGRKPRRILQTPDKVGARAQWSSDGRTIAFHLTAPDREMLQVISAEGGIVRTMLTTPKGQAIPFAWSPDSREVVAGFDGMITAFPITGGSARVVARLREKGYETPSWLGWSPDGQRLAFHGGNRLHLLAMATGDVADLKTSLSSARSFTWSPDSKMISCISEESRKVRPAGVVRQLDVAEALKKAPPIATRKPTATTNTFAAERITGPVFTDNFDNGPSKHWQFWDSPDTGWTPRTHAVANGVLMLSGARACLHGIDWTNYHVTVRVRLEEALSPGEGTFGIATRATPSRFTADSMNRYTLSVLSKDNAPQSVLLGMYYVDPEGKGHPSAMKESPVSFDRNTWHLLEVEVRGQRLRGYLDGKLMGEATDDRLSKGGVWLTSYRTRVLFDDFSVRQLP